MESLTNGKSVVNIKTHIGNIYMGDDDILFDGVKVDVDEKNEFDKDGYNNCGYNVDGYDVHGFDIFGIDMNGLERDGTRSKWLSDWNKELKL